MGFEKLNFLDHSVFFWPISIEEVQS